MKEYILRLNKKFDRINPLNIHFCCCSLLNGVSEENPVVYFPELRKLRFDKSAVASNGLIGAGLSETLQQQVGFEIR